VCDGGFDRPDSCIALRGQLFAQGLIGLFAPFSMSASASDFVLGCFMLSLMAFVSVSSSLPLKVCF
jgi:hypothetical protein